MPGPHRDTARYAVATPKYTAIPSKAPMHAAEFANIAEFRSTNPLGCSTEKNATNAIASIAAVPPHTIGQNGRFDLRETNLAATNKTNTGTGKYTIPNSEKTVEAAKSQFSDWFI